MTLKKAKDKEVENLVYEAKKGNKAKILIIVENFQGLVINVYNKFIYDQVDVSLEEYMQECNLKIMECINDTNNENYWQLSSLIKRSLIHKTFDLKKRSRTYKDSNVFYEDGISVHNAENDKETHKFEDLILGDMTVEHIYNTFIKDRLSNEEKNIFCTYISGEELEEYAKKKGVKVQTVKRTFRKVINKIRRIDRLKKYHFMTLVICMFIKNIQDFIEITDLCGLMGMLAI